MAKCAICNKGIGLFSKPVKLYDETVCQDCWTRLGFNEQDKDKYKNKAAAFIARGKTECEAVIAKSERKANAIREYSYPVVGVSYENENGNPIQKLLKSFLSEQNDEKYDGMTNKDIKEDCSYDEKIWEYPETETDGDLLITEYNNEPAIKVYAELPLKTHIGWIPKESVASVSDILKKHPCDLTISVNGGNYKYLDYDDDKDVVVSEKGTYGARVTITYDADASVPDCKSESEIIVEI